MYIQQTSGNSSSPSALFADALLRQQAGLHGEAAALYELLLQRQPAHIEALRNLAKLLLAGNQITRSQQVVEQALMLAPTDAEFHYLLGRIAKFQNRITDAIKCYRTACRLSETRADYQISLGIAQRANGETSAAVDTFRRAIAINPTEYSAYVNLGNALRDLEFYHDAALAYQTGIQLNNRSAEAYNNLGAVLLKIDETESACMAFEHAVALKPDYLQALLNVGVLLSGEKGGALRGPTRSLDNAINYLRRALQLDPNSIDAWQGLIDAFMEKEDFVSADMCARKRLELTPESAPALVDMARVLTKLKRLDEAVELYRRAIDFDRDYPVPYHNLGVVMRLNGKPEEAIMYLRQALQRGSDPATTYQNWAFAALQNGDYADAWPKYENRLLPEAKEGVYLPYYKIPIWNGESLHSKTILIHREQGLGDEIMFASQYTEIVDMAKHVVLSCDARLEKLFMRSFPRATVIPLDPKQPVIEHDPLKQLVTPLEIDKQIAAGSLALHRRRSADDFPRRAHYLVADPRRIDYWRDRLDTLGAGLKVGISWRGGIARTGQSERSIPLDQLLPSFTGPRVHFVSLQYTDCQEELACLHRQYGIEVQHWQDALDDYDETAALVKALDLVVSVCTAVIHLSGALGQRVWIMAPLVPEWRYGLTGENMPWYPSARVFRQSQRGNWAPVIRKVASELELYATTR